MKKLSTYILCCLFATAQSVATVPTKDAISNISIPLWGHRGSVWGLENSKDAFLNGVRAGYKYLETDVKVTKDGVYICFHDDNLKRLGGESLASVVIAETNWADLKDRTFKQKRQGRNYTGQICTLSDFLDICKENNVTPVIDLKHTVGFNNDDYSKAAGLVEFVKSKGLESNVVFLSSNHNCLEKIRSTSSKVTLQRSSTPDGVLSTSVLNFCKTNNVNFGVNLDATTGISKGLISTTHVNKAHNAGLKIGVYCVENYDDLKKYEDMGVDNITFEPYILITSDPTAPALEAIATTKVKQEITITGLNLTEEITQIRANKPMFTVSPTTLPKEGGKLTITYKPTKEGNDTAKIYLESSEGIKGVQVVGKATAEPLPFIEGWNYSETSGQTASWATDFSQLRNLDFGDGKLYIVAEGQKIIIVNAQTGEYMGELNNEEVAGGAIDLVDCKYISGKIVASNIATGSSPLKVYVWDDDYAKPRVLLQTNDLGGFTRLGDCIGIRGNLTNGQLLFAGNDASGNSSIVCYTITDGVCSTSPNLQALKDESGNPVKLGYSPRVIGSGEAAWWCNGSATTPAYINTAGVSKAASKVNSEAVGGDSYGNAFKSFTFDGTSYGISTAYDSDASDAIINGHIAFFKKGTAWNASQCIGTYPVAGLGSTKNTSFSSSVATATNGTAGMEMWVLVHNQGIAYFKHGTPKNWNPTLTGTPPVTSLTLPKIDKPSLHVENGILSIEGIDAAQIEVYTIIGQKIGDVTNSNTIELNAPRGVYIAKVTTDNGVTYLEKICLKTP